MTYEDRLELLISAVVGAVVGLVTGHLLRHGWMMMDEHGHLGPHRRSRCQWDGLHSPGFSLADAPPATLKRILTQINAPIAIR
jgi:hypothetical protein